MFNIVMFCILCIMCELIAREITCVITNIKTYQDNIDSIHSIVSNIKSCLE